MGVTVIPNQMSDDNNSDRRSIDDQNNSPRRSITPSTPGDRVSIKVCAYYMRYHLDMYMHIQYH